MWSHLDLSWATINPLQVNTNKPLWTLLVPRVVVLTYSGVVVEEDVSLATVRLWLWVTLRASFMICIACVNLLQCTSNFLYNIRSTCTRAQFVYPPSLIGFPAACQDGLQFISNLCHPNSIYGTSTTLQMSALSRRAILKDMYLSINEIVLCRSATPLYYVRTEYPPLPYSER